jgi:glycosyltransferase involved in cell wall biosynthesis
MTPQLLVLLCSVVGPTPSGGDRLAVELARHWPVGGERPTVLTSAAGARQLERASWLPSSGEGRGGRSPFVVQVIRGPSSSSRMASWSLGSFTAPPAARALVRKITGQGHQAVVLSSSPFPPDLAAALAARAARAVWIQSWQLVMPSRGGYRSALSYVSQQLCLALARRWCRTLVVPTTLMAAQARRRGFRDDQIHVAGLAVDREEVAAGIADRPTSEKSFDAVFVGRFHAQKGLSDLLAAWKLVQQTLPAASLEVIGDGDGPEAEAFKAGLDQFAPATVRRLGVLSGPDKYAAMARAKIFVFPSHHESWGHVVIEAMATGLPVVGYDLPSSVEVFGDAMEMVPVGDVRAFAAKVVGLLSDEARRDEFRIRGRRLAETYDWARIADGFYESVSSPQLVGVG